MFSAPLLKLSMSTGTTRALLEEQFIESIFKCVATIAASEEVDLDYDSTAGAYHIILRTVLLSTIPTGLQPVKARGLLLKPRAVSVFLLQNAFQQPQCHKGTWLLLTTSANHDWVLYETNQAPFCSRITALLCILLKSWNEKHAKFELLCPLIFKPCSHTL